MNRIFAPLVFSVIFAAGCASTYQQKSLTPLSAKLVQGKSILIATPANGSYGGQTYVSSGQATANAVRQAFSGYSNRVSVSTECTEIECLKNKSDTPFDYYVVPQILHWEDRATEWSGKKDKLEVKLTVYLGTDSTEISNQLIAGKSKWATFGGDHPEDLLRDPVTLYVQGLY